jgi:hypothetical protein
MISERMNIFIDGDTVGIVALESAYDLTNINSYVKKTMNLKDFINEIKCIDQKIISKIFCPETVKYEQSGNKIILTLFSPLRKVTLHFHSGLTRQIYENALMPAYFMKVEFLLNGTYMGAHIKMLGNVHSIAEVVESKEYFMPFPNIYFDGNICWGSILECMNITLTNANLLIDIFNNSWFNYDLFSDKLKKITNKIQSIRTIDDYFQYLTTIDVFPDELMFEDI